MARRRRKRRQLGQYNPGGCDMVDFAAKVADVRATYKPKKKFKPLFDHTLNMALHSAKSGYCQRAGLELRNARRVAGY